MGCASSAPLVESGKNLVEGVKETATDTLTKGEKAFQNASETAKEGITTGVETVKDTVQTALNTAEQSVGSVVEKIGETFNITASNTKDNITEELESAKDQTTDFLANASETAGEAVSEAETVLVSETEHAREAFVSGSSPYFETVRSLEDDLDGFAKDIGERGAEKIEELGEEIMETVKKNKSDAMEVVEDLETETYDMLGENVEKVDKHLEELAGEKKGEDIHVSKEEPPPTLWEAAADAILMKRALKSLEPSSFGQERIFFTPSSVHEKIKEDFSDIDAQKDSGLVHGNSDENN